VLEFLANTAVKFLAWVAPFTLRKLYPPDRLADFVKVRVSAQSDGIEYWGSDVPQAKAWITISNLSPFEITLDRAFGSFTYSAQIETFVYLQRHRIRPSTEVTLLLETSLTKEQAAVVRRLRDHNPRPGVTFNALFLCRVRDFEVKRTLDTSHHRLVNFDVVG
jgi:hypothetical protein